MQAVLQKHALRPALFRGGRSRSSVRVRAEVVEVPSKFSKVMLHQESSQLKPLISSTSRACLHGAAASPWRSVPPLCLCLQLSPRGDRVLVKVAEPEEETRAGIVLPASAVKKPTSGMVRPSHQAASLAPMVFCTGVRMSCGDGTQRR